MSSSQASLAGQWNQLRLSGIIIKPPRLFRSPSGVSHLKFVLEHKSEQVEANLPRRSYVRINIVFSGQQADFWSEKLKQSDAVTVEGFLNREEDSSGQGILVLHAQQLVKI